MEPASALSPGLSQAPTITTPAMTQAGMILGTAAYMAPEQAKGRPADRRSDVWAFGVVVYEMLTSRRAFEGEDVSDTLANVLKGEPNWEVLPAGLSPTLAVFLKRCVSKDVKQRLGDIHDMRLALEGAFETAGPVTKVETAKTAQAGWRRALPFAATAVAAIVLTGFGGWLLWPPAAQEAVARFAYVVPDDQPFRNPGRPIVRSRPTAGHLCTTRPAGCTFARSASWRPG
jgi:serine/threonine-protein kinase